MSQKSPPAAPPSRQERLAKLQTETFDVLIIGGGITGVGALREAARRGLKAALVEQGDLASGTSSRSSRLIHGGLRYLEQFEFGLVFEAVSERRVLQEIAAHIVRPLGFLFPVYADSRRGRLTVELGMWLYEALSLFRTPKRHRSLSAEAVLEEEPLLRQEELSGASLYYDCQTDDARLVLETALDAVEQGAVLLTYARAVELLNERGRVVGARVEALHEGKRLEVRAHAVINATGPWTDRLRSGHEPLLRPTKGVHIVLDRARLPIRHADVLFHPEDGRVMFAIPWGERTYIGTTDTFYDGDPACVAADAEDVRYLLAAANHYYPDTHLSAEHVISTWAGLRPLIAEGREDPSALSREHRVVVDPDGLVTIAGGKLTTYRRMAIDVIDRALDLLRVLGCAPETHPSQTERTPLPGARGWPQNDHVTELVESVIEASGERFDRASARRLVWTYGTRAPLLAARVNEDPELAKPLSPCGPERWVEAHWAFEYELAESVEDVLRRRLHVALTHHEQGLDCCEALAARMRRALGWSAAREQAEIERYRAEIARSRAWREKFPTSEPART